MWIVIPPDSFRPDWLLPRRFSSHPEASSLKKGQTRRFMCAVTVEFNLCRCGIKEEVTSSLLPGCACLLACSTRTCPSCTTYCHPSLTSPPFLYTLLSPPTLSLLSRLHLSSPSRFSCFDSFLSGKYGFDFLLLQPSNPHNTMTTTADRLTASKNRTQLTYVHQQRWRIRTATPSHLAMSPPR